MGEVISALNYPRICDNCNKYVFNSMELDFECSECCKFHLQTHEVEISDDNSDIEL